MMSAPVSNPLSDRLDVRTTILMIGAVVLSTAMWATTDTAAQYLTGTVHAIEITWMRFAVHVMFLAFWFRTRLRTAWKTQSLSLQVLRGCCAVISGLLFIGGLAFMPVGEATAITFVLPFIIMGLAALILKETVGARRWIAAAIGLAGVLIIVQPGTDAFRWSAFMPLGAVCFGGMAIVLTRLNAKDDASTTMIYTGVIGFVVSSLAVVFVWKTPEPWEIAVGFIVGLFGALANLVQITAFRHAPASLLAPFNYAQLLWASLFGFIVFGVWPTPMALFGALIIALSGIYSAWRESQEADHRK